MDTSLQLPTIALDGNKYTRGSLLILAGSRRYPGAAVLATLAAEKTGAGYINLAIPASAAQIARSHLLCSPVIEAAEDPEFGCFAATALPAIASEVHRIDAICAGPGLTTASDVREFIRELIQMASTLSVPLLLDADALNVISVEPSLFDALRSRTSPLVLTPHTGELARLYNAYAGKLTERATELSIPVTQAASYLSNELAAAIVAKGPTTYIASADDIYESNQATPALAKAGTGDVLAGIISSLLAQGMQAEKAALAGVRIHSRAGILAEQELGRRSVTALDVIAAIPEALKQYESTE